MNEYEQEERRTQDEERKAAIKDTMVDIQTRVIREDADRVEAIITENADLIQDMIFKRFEAIRKCHCVNAVIEVNALFGANLGDLIDRKIELCAENDAEQELF